MTAPTLAGIAWHRVFGSLLDLADATLLDRCAYYAGKPFGCWGSPPVVFAAAVAGTPRPVLREVLAGHTRNPYTVADWLHGNARVVLTAAAADDIPRPVPAEPGRLHVDPALSDLPLLDLAEGVARHRGGLRVTVAKLAPGLAGSFNHERRHVRLDVDQGGREAWPHELAHALDPALPRHQDIPADEAFADRLAVLLDQHRPDSVEKAQLHIAACLDQGTPTRAGDRVTASEEMPEGGAVSLLAFLSLPLVAS